MSLATMDDVPCDTDSPTEEEDQTASFSPAQVIPAHPAGFRASPSAGQPSAKYNTLEEAISQSQSAESTSIHYPDGRALPARVFLLQGARFRAPSQVPYVVVEAAGIEPASAEGDGDSEGESDLPGPDAGRIASESSHVVAPTNDDPRSERGPSEELASQPEVAGDEPSG